MTPINPCGMGMDLIRSCYKTTMRFFHVERGLVEVNVRWFFCLPGAKVFPHYHLYASGNWASDKNDWVGPGEVAWRPRPYDKGVSIPQLTGQHFCGPLAVYQGAAFERSICTDATGLSECCLDNVQWCDCRDEVPDVVFVVITRVVNPEVDSFAKPGDVFELRRNPLLDSPMWVSDFFWFFGVCGPLALVMECAGHTFHMGAGAGVGVAAATASRVPFHVSWVNYNPAQGGVCQGGVNERWDFFLTRFVRRSGIPPAPPAPPLGLPFFPAGFFPSGLFLVPFFPGVASGPGPGPGGGFVPDGFEPHGFDPDGFFP